MFNDPQKLTRLLNVLNGYLGAACHHVRDILVGMRFRFESVGWIVYTWPIFPGTRRLTNKARLWYVPLSLGDDGDHVVVVPPLPSSQTEGASHATYLRAKEERLTRAFARSADRTVRTQEHSGEWGRVLISVCIICYLSGAAIIAIEIWEWISNFIRQFYKICYYGMISWSPVEFKPCSRKHPGVLTLGYELLSNVRTNVISTICVFLPCHVYVSFPDPSIPQTVPYSRTQLTCLVGPADVTTDGICRAGVLLHLIDECAGVVAAKHCATKIATVSFDAINFRHRIKKGKASSITGRLRFR